MKKVLALLLPGVLFSSMLLSSMIVFSTGCIVRPGRGHGYGHGHGHGHGHGRGHGRHRW